METEETEDLIVEFEGNFDFDAIKGKEIQVLAVDSDEPVLRIESKFYKLDIKDSLGSRLLLKQDSRGKLEFYGKTDKEITARRVMLKPK